MKSEEYCGGGADVPHSIVVVYYTIQHIPPCGIALEIYKIKFVHPDCYDIIRQYNPRVEGKHIPLAAAAAHIISQVFLNIYTHALYIRGHHFLNRIDIEEEKQRREGKGRRYCLDDGIYSIPCRTTDLSPG